MIREVRIECIDELFRSLNELSNRYAYRGHGDESWELRSTLERACGAKFGTDFVDKQERLCVSTFKAKFHLYDKENLQPDSTLAWLALMQHYGVPTRLLDFTLSPYVALYFATEGWSPTHPASLAVYAIDYVAMMEASFSYIRSQDRDFNDDNTSMALDGRQDKVFEDTVNRFSYPILWMTEPARLNVRIDRQAGCFLVSGKKTLSVEDAIADDLYKHVDARKYVIPGALFPQVYAMLRKMNISATTVYGDLAGLAGALRAQLRVYATA